MATTKKKPAKQPRTRQPLANRSTASHADEARALAARLKRAFPHRTTWKICHATRSSLDALAERRLHDTGWSEVPDWVVREHVPTLENFTPDALLVLVPAFLRCALNDWQPANPAVRAVQEELCKMSRTRDSGFVDYLAKNQRRFVLEFLVLMARTPAFEEHRAEVMVGVRVWKELAKSDATIFVGGESPTASVRRRDFTPIASGGRLADLVQDMALDQLSFEFAALAGLRLPGGYMPRLNLRGADLRKANLRGANLEGSDLSGALLDEIDLRDARLSYCTFTDASLRGARMENVEAPHATFDHADLSGADLSRALLAGSRFVGTFVEKFRVSGADLTNTYVDLMRIDGNDRALFTGAATVRGSSLELVTNEEMLDRKEGDVPFPAFERPQLRGEPIARIGRPQHELRWKIAPANMETKPSKSEHGSFRVQLRPDYRLTFLIKESARVCGVVVDHPAGDQELSLLRWLGGRDVAKLRRTTQIKVETTRLVLHRRSCSCSVSVAD